MTFLPIVDRELRVAARWKSTYWTRVLAALLAVIIAGSFIAIDELSRSALGGANLGGILFGILKWLCFAFACLAGALLTSDCLSEEKREGTLGLLFLTDLRGYDVVLGKLLASSLRAFYGLLAVFPILGLTLLLGGTTGGEFWRVVLMLLNTLWLSLGLGLFVSAICRDAQKAMTGAVVLTLLVVVLLPLLDAILAGAGYLSSNPFLGLASPWLALDASDNPSFPYFWLNVALVHGLGWLFLGLASIYAQRNWQEPSMAGSVATTKPQGWISLGPLLRRSTRRRRPLGEDHPALWLARRDYGGAWRKWTLVLGLAALLMAAFFLDQDGDLLEVLGSGSVGLLGFLLQLWIASRACGFFVNAMRTGTLELLLATPLRERDIVRGHFLALCHGYGLPVIGLLAARLVTGAWQIILMMDQRANSGFDLVTFQSVNLAMGIIATVTTLLALAWYGMWMGLTTKKQSVAVIKTYVFVQVLPFLGIIIFQGFLFFLIPLFMGRMLGRGNVMPFWMVPIVVGVLTMTKDLIFITWSRRRLFGRLRSVAAGVDEPSPPRVLRTEVGH